MVQAPRTGIVNFKIDADDHARLWLDGDLLIDHWHEQGVNNEPPRGYKMVKDRLYEVIMEYREVTGPAWARLMWDFGPVQGSWEYSNTGGFRSITSEFLYSLYEIDRSPVQVHVVSAATDALSTECHGPGLYTAVVHRKTWFSLCPRDRFRNMRDDSDLFFLSSEFFSATLTLIDDKGYRGVGVESLAPDLLYNNETYCFTAYYTPERAGLYSLEVVYRNFRGEIGLSLSGSPFNVMVSPDMTFGPYSQVYGLPSKPEYPTEQISTQGGMLNLVAGNCWNFTIVARDTSRNLRLTGGDSFQVYYIRVDYNANQNGVLPPTPGGYPNPTPSPTARWEKYSI